MALAEAPLHIDSMKVLLERAMCFDKPKMRVHRQIFDHHHVCVEPKHRQAKTSGLGYGMFDQAAA
jgi:hypothetical protein